MFTRLLPLFSLPLLLLPTMAASHDLWIERDTTGGLLSLAYGHEGSGHTGAKRLEYKVEAVKQSTCFNASGLSVTAERGRAYPATLKGSCAATWFFLSSGYWSKTPYGTKNLPKNEAGATLSSWLSLESVKRIDAWSPALARPLTQEFELAPLENPLTLKSGDKLRVQAFFQGKPVAGVTLAYFGKPRGVTGADGKLNIRLKQPGLQLIQASLEQPLDDVQADKAIHASTLQFDIQ